MKMGDLYIGIDKIARLAYDGKSELAAFEAEALAERLKGYELVPEKPTYEMIKIGWSMTSQPEKIWKAMIKAARESNE